MSAFRNLQQHRETECFPFLQPAQIRGVFRSMGLSSAGDGDSDTFTVYYNGLDTQYALERGESPLVQRRTKCFLQEFFLRAEGRSLL